jgi:hypothetical protein
MKGQITVLALLALLGVACGRRESEAASRVSNPFLAHALPSEQRSWIEGRVLERLSAGHYVYLRVGRATGDSSWLVSLAATTPRGEQVRALVLGRAQHFHSRRLARDFSPLLFAAVRSAAPASASTTLQRVEARR